jgi:hypothetical protein
MRFVVVACLIAFAVGLGVTVAYRMHTEAMAVVVGVLCGVSASIPVSLLVLYAARQGQRSAQAMTPVQPPAAPPQQPPVIVVAPGLSNGQAPQWAYPGLPSPSTPPQPTRAPRDFTIIGDED